VKYQITQSVKAAAEHLGNTLTGCCKAYLHPEVLEA
jgi:DNA topoisomerase IB